MLSTISTLTKLTRSFSTGKAFLSKLQLNKTSILKQTLNSQKINNLFKNSFVYNYSKNKVSPTTVKFNFVTVKPQQVQEKIQEFENFDFSIKLPKEDQDLYIKGMQILNQQQDWDKGYGIMKNLLQKYPNDMGLHLFIGLISEYHERKDMLIKHFEKVLEINPTHHDSRKIRAKLARNYLFSQRIQQGHAIYKQLIEEDPQDWMMTVHYGISIELCDPDMYRLVKVLQAGQKLFKAGLKKELHELLKQTVQYEFKLNEKTKRAIVVIYRHLINVCIELNKQEQADKYQIKLKQIEETNI